MKGINLFSGLKKRILIAFSGLILCIIVQLGFGSQSISPGLITYISCVLFVVFLGRYPTDKHLDINLNIKENLFGLIKNPLFVLDD
jgi:hypothetical protein